jgi:hypothetical protein
VRGLIRTAALHREVGRGYRHISNLAGCIRKVHKTADALDFDRQRAASLLLPLLGAWAGSGCLVSNAATGVEATVGDQLRAPDRPLEHVRLLAHTAAEIAAMSDAGARCAYLVVDAQAEP